MNRRLFSIVKFYISSIVMASSLAFSNHSNASQAVPSVDTVIIQKEFIQRTFKYPAVVTPLIQGKLTSEIQGIVTRIIKKLGEPVKKGEVVFYLRNRQVGQNFNEYAVKSPVPGVVSKLNVYIGKLLVAGEIGGEIVNTKQMTWVVHVPAQDISDIKIGYKAEFESNQEKVQAQVIAISPVINPATGTALMELTPTASEHRLVSGIVGTMSVFLPKIKKITLPPKALVKLNLKNYVRRLNKENQIELIEVQMGEFISGKQVVQGGISEKDEIVIKSSDYIKAGDKVSRNTDQKPPEKTKI